MWKSKLMSDYFLEIGYWMLIINFIGFTVSAVGSIYRKVVVSLDRGKTLYNFWIYAQIINIILAYFIITPLSWFGLAFVPFVGGGLLALCSLFVSHKIGISIRKTINSRRLLSIGFSSLFFIIISFFLNYLLNSENHFFLNIALKLCISFPVGFLLLYFRHKELYYKILLFIKPIFIKLKRNSVSNFSKLF
jgi:hypothetical protein